MKDIMKDIMKTNGFLISDFSNTAFQAAFRRYFGEFGIQVKDWDGLFREINEDGNNHAYVRADETGEVIGFLLFTTIPMKSWFFTEELGFIREFWVAGEHRRQGHGAALLSMTEDYFLERGIQKAILTTDTAEGFYEKRGYRQAPGIQAKNGDMVFVKELQEKYQPRAMGD